MMPITILIRIGIKKPKFEKSIKGIANSAPIQQNIVIIYVLNNFLLYFETSID